MNTQDRHLVTFRKIVEEVKMKTGDKTCARLCVCVHVKSE